MRRLHRNKACGLDRVPAGLIKDLSECSFLVFCMTKYINLCIHFSFFPSSWNILKISPVLKKDKDPHDPPSYRPIHITSVMAKVVAMLVDRKLRSCMKACYCQMAYTPHYGPRDALFTLLSTIHAYKSRGLHAVFVDFRAAFDSIDRAKLIKQ